MRVIYALTTQGRDLYSEMTRVSIASARATNPACEFILACDRQSADCLKRQASPILREVSELLVLDTPPGSGTFRNRFLKASLRSAVDGPFLYLDADTFVQGDISPIFGLDTDVACAPNHSRDDPDDQRWAGDDEVLAQLGWRCRDGLYANGGVIFFNETEGARKFSEAWRERYLEACRTTGKYQDQPALNAALADASLRVAVLPHRYNAQFRRNPDISEGAVVLHFYGSWHTASTQYDSLVARLLSGKSLPTSRINALVESKAAWKRDVLLEGSALRKVVGRVRHKFIAWRERNGRGASDCRSATAKRL